MNYHLRLNGKRVSPEEFHRKRKIGGSGIPMVAAAYSEAKPLISDGLGCMRGQVQEMREAIKERGIQGVKVRNNGQLEITSRRGRAEVCRMRGLHDNDAGYGDT